MQAHIRNYLKAFNMGEQDWFGCEVCGSQAQDFHHLLFKSRGGGDNAENIILLCRKCHNEAHSQQLTQEELQEIHNFHLTHIPYEKS